ncbi:MULTISPECIES: CDGSH iron-sulfur domain-containing protein [Streptomyces]|uniref:CDGSH iron-sulfur domain-containing protein n=1 Tax=Streptomyces TaxID=1883 RepID=UPI00067D828D|nr:CDGSH iron-sulfur domain-containing protein [Streptomyces sp. CNS654]
MTPFPLRRTTSADGTCRGPDPAEALPAATVTVYPDGPLLLRGDAEIRLPSGEVLAGPGRTVALCRCGRSALPPFCDGSHKAGGFRGPLPTPQSPADPS